MGRSSWDSLATLKLSLSVLFSNGTGPNLEELGNAYDADLEHADQEHNTSVRVSARSVTQLQCLCGRGVSNDEKDGRTDIFFPPPLFKPAETLQFSSLVFLYTNHNSSSSGSNHQSSSFICLIPLF